MLMTSQPANMELYDTKISSLEGNHEMHVKVTKVDKEKLLSINNPKYGELSKRCSHLGSVKMDNPDRKPQLPIHLVLGSGKYADIKTSAKLLVGKELEPIPEKTKLGWFIMSPGVEFHNKAMPLTQTSQADFENLCRLDVLGLAWRTTKRQFSKILKKISFATKRSGTKRTSPGNRLAQIYQRTGRGASAVNSLVKRLERNGDHQRYQLKQGIIEPAPTEVTGKEFYIPHKGIVKHSAETTKLRIVYDASAKESNSQPSLNDCLNPGPPLQNHLWSILVLSRFYPILLTSDLEKAFQQVRIKQEERDALRFHCKVPGRNVKPPTDSPERCLALPALHFYSAAFLANHQTS